MAQTAADVMMDMLHDWGVEVIFGLPGDGINGLMESLRTRQDDIRFIQVRHEESAALAAAGYAKWTGRLGVCLATSGPGGLHLINGLYDAKLDGQPVLAITGHHYHDLIDTHAQQDVDLSRVFEDVTVYNTRVMGPEHVANVTDLACRTALSRRGVAHINFPVDLQDREVPGKPSRRNAHAQGRGVNVVTAAVTAAPAQDVQAAAALLNESSKVAILAGRGALGAAAELEEVAELLGAPVATALQGKGALADDHPFATGGVGLLGTKPSQDALKACDALLIVGSSFPYLEFMPEPGQARAVQIDIDPVRIGLRYPIEVGLVGDSRETLRALAGRLHHHEDRSFLEQAQAGKDDWWQVMEERATRTDIPMKPQVVSWELGKLLDDDAIVAGDSGTVTIWFARQIKARAGQQFALSGTLATMACAVPYAIAAQVAYPHRQVVAFVGDGGFSMLMAELATAVKYELPIKVVVVRNDYLGQIRWEQMVFLGNPEFAVDLQPIDYVKVAEACGVRGYRIEDPSDCRSILSQALAEPGPALVEAVVDSNEPPLPPHITADQATHFAQSLMRGQPEAIDIMRKAMTTKIRELV
jgi:pyruvate dehydrogenase (quinone)/pyruvate oxidase